MDVDELRVKLSTNFMKSVVSKLISTMIRNKFGIKVDFSIKDLDVEYINGEARVRTSLEANLDKGEFTKIIKSVGLD